MKLVIQSEKKIIAPPNLCFPKDMTNVEQKRTRSFVVVFYLFICFVGFVGTRAIFC